MSFSAAVVVISPRRAGFREGQFLLGPDRSAHRRHRLPPSVAERKLPPGPVYKSAGQMNEALKAETQRRRDLCCREVERLLVNSTAMLNGEVLLWGRSPCM